jgi:hypothetical protein
MDDKSFINRMLETENLTDNLEDDDANTLLNWGIQQVGRLISNPLVAGEKVNGLMAVLRKINHLVPDIGTKSPQEVAADLADLARTYEQTFESALPSGAVDLQNLAASMQTMSTPDAIQTILGWIHKEQE